jgi:hypothetical protein
MTVTLYGIVAVTFMMVMYALEARGRGYILGFAAGCVASSVYGFLSGAWPFGVVELIWAGIAVRRWADQAPSGGPVGRSASPG